MIFSKLTSATLFFLQALTATGRPNLRPSEIIRSKEGSWDPSGVKFYWHHEDDYDHWPDYEDDYWEHDHDHDHDHDEHYWDEEEDDHYWGYYDSDYEHDYHPDWDYDHDNDWDDDWDHDWDSNWVSDWDEWDDDWDSSWDNTWINKWYNGWGSKWRKSSNPKVGWDYDDYNPDYEYGALQVYAGAGTVYTQDGLAGSCGIVYDDDAFICALSNTWMNGEYMSSDCGRQIRVTNLGSFYPVGGEGNSIIVTVMDTCASCDEDHIDLSIAAWNALTDDTEFGMLDVQWSFLDE